MRPQIICHMISSADGRLLTERYSLPFDGKERNALVGHYSEIDERLGGDAWIIGRNTAQAHYVKDTFDHKDYPPTSSPKNFIGKRDSRRLAIIVDPKGKLLYKDAHLDGDCIVTVLGEQVSEAYLSQLQKCGISYVFAGKDGRDLARAMDALGKEFALNKVLIEGGGVINGAFLKAGLIDELSLMIYPGLDGLAGMPSIFEYAGALGEMLMQGQSLDLISVEKLADGVVWLYYRFHKD